MTEFASKLFDSSDFPARWRSGGWDAGLGWLHIVADLGLWSAYLAIPVILLAFAARKREIPFRNLFWLFGTFLLLCGTAHLLEAVMFWWPAYRLAGLVKLAAALVSWAAVLDLVRVTPQALAMRTPDELQQEIAARVRAEAALRASEEMYRAVVESASDAIVTADAARRIVGWNRGAEQVFGYTAEEAVGRPATLIASDEVLRSLTATTSPGPAVEVVGRRKAGGEFPVELTLTAWQTGSGKFTTAILRDVTARKRAEDQLRDAEARLRLALEAARMGTWEWQQGTDRVVMDAQNARHIDFALEEFDGRLATALARVHPDDRTAVARSLEAVGDGGQDFEFEYRVARPAGEVKWNAARGRIVSTPGDPSPRLIGVTFDVSERKRSENQILQAEARFRAAFDSAPIGMALVAPDGRFLKVNLAFGRMLGYTEGEFLATDYQTVTHPDDVAADVENARRMLAGEIATYQMEKRYVHRDGGVIWGQLSVAFVPDSSGGVDYFVSQVEDVTARKRADQAERDRADGLIRRQGALLALERNEYPDLASELDAVARAAFEAVGADRVRVWLLTPDRMALECVAAYSGPLTTPPPLPPFELAKYPRFVAALNEELVMTSDDVRNDPRTAELLGSGIAPDVVSALSAPARYRTGMIGTVSLAACGTPREWTRDEQDFVAVLADRVVVAVQADHRRRAENAVHVRDRAIEAIPSGVVITDPNLPDNPVIYANRGFEQITGYTAAEVVGRNCRLLQGRDTDPVAVAALREAVDDGRPCSVELLNYKKDGTPFMNAMRVAPVADENGHVTHFVAALVDMTGYRRLEQQLVQAHKMEAVGHLAGGVAHDFNNLLNIITGYTELLLADPPGSDEATTYLTEIMAAGRRAADLTRQLLAFSRKQVLQPRPIRLNDLITGLNKMLVRLIGEDIRLTTVLHPDLKWVMADPGQVEQVLTNLVVNARDAMPTGGRLVIETFPVDLDEAFAQTRPDLRPGRYALLAVTDAGAGMTDETKAHLFEPFFTTKGLGKGTGLGLATVHGIVKQSGGHIDVYSEVGRGTTFKVYLPATDPDPDSDPNPSPAKPAPPRGHETILLVEDEAKLRAMTATVLRAAGYTVREAGGGNDAAREFTTGPVDLLLTDVVMPGLSGREVAERLTAQTPDLRVMYMSGYTDDAVVRHGVLADEVAFLQKPFSVDALLRKVREVLDAE